MPLVVHVQSCRPIAERNETEWRAYFVSFQNNIGLKIELFLHYILHFFSHYNFLNASSNYCITLKRKSWLIIKMFVISWANFIFGDPGHSVGRAKNHAERSEAKGGGGGDWGLRGHQRPCEQDFYKTHKECTPSLKSSEMGPSQRKIRDYNGHC